MYYVDLHALPVFERYGVNSYYVKIVMSFIFTFVATGIIPEFIFNAFDQRHNHSVGMGSTFFTLGALFGHRFLFPLTFRFLGEFGGADMKFLPKIDEYYSFYSWFLLGLGLVFQIPVVIFILARIGLVTPGFLLRAWKWVILGAFVVSAFITPTPDMVTQTALALPMIGLYFFGVAVAWAFGRKRRPEEDVSAGE